MGGKLFDTKGASGFKWSDKIELGAIYIKGSCGTSGRMEEDDF